MSDENLEPPADKFDINNVVSDAQWVKGISAEELRLFTQKYSTSRNPESLKCTSCSRTSTVLPQEFFVRHPLLGVPVCHDCRLFFFQGTWERDDEGYSEFCCWCGNGGGNAMMCSQKRFQNVKPASACKNVFCNNCIKRNIGRKGLNKIMEIEEWTCFECDTTQIMNLRAQYFYLIAPGNCSDPIGKVLSNLNEMAKGFSEDSKKMTRIHMRQINEKPELRTDETYFNNQASKITELIQMTFQNLRILQTELTEMTKKESMNLQSSSKVERECQNPASKKESAISPLKDKGCDQIKFEKSSEHPSLDDPSPFETSEGGSKKPKKNADQEKFVITSTPKGVAFLRVNALLYKDNNPFVQTESIKSLGASTSIVVNGNSQSSAETRTFNQEFDAEKSCVTEVVQDNQSQTRRHDEASSSPNLSESETQDSHNLNQPDNSSESVPENLPQPTKSNVTDLTTTEGLQTESSQNHQISKSIRPLNHVLSSDEKSQKVEMGSKNGDVQREEQSPDKNSEENIKLSLLLSSDSDCSSNNSDGIILKHKKLRSKTIRNMLIRGDSLRKRVFMTSSSDEEDIPSSDDSSKKRKKEKVLEQKETPLPSVFSNSSSIGLGFQISQSSDTESNGLGYTRPKSSRNLDLETLSFEKSDQEKDLGTSSTNPDSVLSCSVKLKRVSDDILKELKSNGFINIQSHSHLRHLCRNRIETTTDSELEIDRLCNLSNLTRGIKKNKYRKERGRYFSKKSKLIDDESEGALVYTSEGDEEETFSVPSSSVVISDELIKQKILESSDSDVDPDQIVDSNEGRKNRKEINQKESLEKDQIKQEQSESDEEIIRKRKRALVFKRFKFSDTDSSNEEKVVRSKKLQISLEETDSDDQIHRKKKKMSKGDDDDDYFEPRDSDDKEDSESEEGSQELGSDSDVAPVKRKRSKRQKDSDDESSSDGEPRPKKRNRIKKGALSSENEEETEKDSPSKGRHNIRKIIKDKDLAQSSKDADREERDRRKRMEERQKLYNKTFDLKDGVNLKELPLDFDPVTKEVYVEVDRDLVCKMKPHQGRGVKFMWDAVFESKKDVEEGRCPGGAILAHCMGLGKTLQTIVLVHTAMVNFPNVIRCVLILCPVNTIKNWVEEFDKWLEGDLMDKIGQVYDSSNWKSLGDRAQRTKDWMNSGGCMIMGYEMYRNLTTDGRKKSSSQLPTFMTALVDPGPDLVICDEGHLLKNDKAAVTSAVNKIVTKRRIILTGTPLQNNLAEYFSMVNFVKPNLLGTYSEFKNRFVNPIQNGQHSDSTERDVRIMKKRSFILSDLLKGCLQRLDYNVLVPFLQPKHEYVLSICLTDLQKTLYTFYLENYARAGHINDDGKLEGGRRGGLFNDVQNLSRIWNHPFILQKAKERVKKCGDDEDSESDEVGSLKDFVVDSSDDDSPATSTNEDDDLENAKPLTRGERRKVGGADLVGGIGEAKKCSQGWWSQFVSDEKGLMEIEHGSKMVLLMEILKECELLGDKVLVFSQSLLSLDLIEAFLKHENDRREVNPSDPDYKGSWESGKDYFRLDGSTPAEQRSMWCNYFNQEKNYRIRLFLISTKAGGLGINLVSANRVIIFDASWNPAHDVQSIFRVYRFGQKKPVYIYRFLAKGTMEEKIYDRQVTKQSLSARVVDEQQIERHFTMNELSELYIFKDDIWQNRPVPNFPKDRLLCNLLTKYPKMIWKFHDHDSLLENQVDENLTEDERKDAWKEFEDEKNGIFNKLSGDPNISFIRNINFTPGDVYNMFKIKYPNHTHEELLNSTNAYILQVQSGLTRKPAYDKAHYRQEMDKAKQEQQRMYPGVYRQQNLLNSNEAGPSTSGYPAMSTLTQLAEANRAYLATQQIIKQQAMEDQAMWEKQRRQIFANNSSDDDVIFVEEIPQEIFNTPRASGSIARRGRPRLDPGTDFNQ